MNDHISRVSRKKAMTTPAQYLKGPLPQPAVTKAYALMKEIPQTSKKPRLTKGQSTVPI